MVGSVGDVQGLRLGVGVECRREILGRNEGREKDDLVE